MFIEYTLYIQHIFFLLILIGAFFMLFGFFYCIVEPIYSPTIIGNSDNLILINAIFPKYVLDNCILYL